MSTTTQNTIGTNVTPATSVSSTPNMDALKNRLHATWTAGDYDYFSRFMEVGTIEFFDRLKLPASSTLLDVGCGSGQLALIAARKGLRVTGVDIAANWIDSARGRARFEHLDARFDVGDAEALPYPDASFDVTASVFGAMFAPQPVLVAKELLRVTRPGGIIAMANWTAQGFIGDMFKLIARFIAPANMPSPVLWGDEETVKQRFGAGAAVKAKRVMFDFVYPFAPAEVVKLFREYYGPTVKAFGALGEAEAAALNQELESLWSSRNTATDGTTKVASEYLQVIARRA
jgi:ubiquinone/menaquinone biosynthesis C-methylase UbiE